MTNHSSPLDGLAPAPVQVITSEQSEWWVSVHDILKFLPHSEPGQVSIISQSEHSIHFTDQ